MNWTGSKGFEHLTFTTDAGEVVTLSNLSTFGVPVSESTKEDLRIELASETSKLAGTYVLKGTRSLNVLKTGTQIEQAISLLDRKLTSKGVDCHVGGFKEVAGKFGFGTEVEARANLKVKTVFQLTFE